MGQRKSKNISKLLVIYRLFDPHYGENANKSTLFVRMREDNTLKYSFISGWGSSGIGEAESNFQLQKPLPLGSRNFKTVEELDLEVQSVLATGVGSNKIKTYEILNDLR